MIHPQLFWASDSPSGKSAKASEIIFINFIVCFSYRSCKEASVCGRTLQNFISILLIFGYLDGVYQAFTSEAASRLFMALRLRESCLCHLTCDATLVNLTNIYTWTLSPGAKTSVSETSNNEVKHKPSGLDLTSK